MIRNYIRIAWRNLIKNRTVSLINIIGLSLSVAFCLLLFFYIRHEQSFDSFHEKKDCLYRLEMTRLWEGPVKEPKKGLLSFLHQDEQTDYEAIFPVIVGLDIKQAFPEIQSVTRFKNNGTYLVKAGPEIFKQENTLYADENFFQNFSFPLQNGNAASVLKSKTGVVLSESAARKYFGADNPIGKTLELVSSDSNQLYTVMGVAADAPENSSIQYNMILPLLSDGNYEYNLQERFNHSTHLCMIELDKKTNVALFEQKINTWAKSYFSEYFAYFKNPALNTFHLNLRPLAECHYSAVQPWGHYTSTGNMYELACLVIVILLIASVNYVLLGVFNAAGRSQEVGVRKVMGASRKTVIFQFWTEAQLLVIFSVAIGLIMANILLPFFNHLMGATISLSAFPWTEVFIVLIVLCVLLGLLAGYYPAWFISRMKPVSIIKTFQTFRINPAFSRIMVITQYTACVILMFAAFIISLQMRYVSRKDLGFDKEQILIVNNPSYDLDFTKKVKERLYNYAASQSSILQYTGMNGGLDGGNNTNGFKLNGEQKWLNQLTVDYNYFEMLNLPMVQGRSFSRDFTSDTSRAARNSIVNETLFRMLGDSAKLGEYNSNIRSTIIGVVKDYHFEGLSKKIGPEQHVLATRYLGSFLFKIKPGYVQQTIEGLEKEWKQTTGNYPFEYKFLDDTLSRLYDADLRWRKIIQASCFFAILIACMGLFGLSAINAVNRTREIGIRKVLGAGMYNIVSRLTGSFVIMMVIAIIIASPLAAWLMNRWLDDFAYHINLQWWMFAAVAAIAFVIAMVTVSLHAFKAATANPVDSLRTE